MLNLALVHLLMTPAVIAIDIGLTGVLIPLSFSLAIIAFTYISSRREDIEQQPFLKQHWLLALKRYRLLLIAYGITAGLIALGHLLAMGSPDPNMQEILQTVFIRIAVMPVVVVVMICFFLESSAIGLAAKGQTKFSADNK